MPGSATMARINCCGAPQPVLIKTLLPIPIFLTASAGEALFSGYGRLESKPGLLSFLWGLPAHNLGGRDGFSALQTIADYGLTSKPGKAVPPQTAARMQTAADTDMRKLLLTASEKAVYSAAAALLQEVTQSYGLFFVRT